MEQQKILCPIHEEKMREEYADYKWTAFCLKCPKRYELCYFVHYMDPCVKFKDHNGLHLTYRGTEFSSDYKTTIYNRQGSSFLTEENKNVKIAFNVYEEIGPAIIFGKESKIK